MICVISGRAPKDPKLLYKYRNLCVFDEQRVGLLELSDALTPESGACKGGGVTRTLRHIVMGAATVPVLGRAGRICPLQDMHERKEHSRGIRSINGARTVAATAAVALFFTQ